MRHLPLALTVLLICLSHRVALAQHHEHGGGGLLASQEVLPIAEPNDQRRAAGRMVDGELRVELVAVRAAWYPRGPDGPRIETLAFAEAGGLPQVPGPLIRVAAGTPVNVTVHNTLDREIQVRGLLDRGTMEVERPKGVPPVAPNFLFADSLVVPSGATRQVRFTPTTEATSFYFGRTRPPFWVPFAQDQAAEVAFGMLVVDPAEPTPPDDERLIVICS